ncbi:MAG: ABC transporter permease [Acidobacteriota bacterium]
MSTAFLQDVRYGLRMLVNRPGFTLAVVLTLALGMGANTAIFSVVEAVLLRPLPFSNPEQLVLLRDDLTQRQLQNIGMSVPELRDLQQSTDIFESVSAVWPVDANLTGSDRPERIQLLAVSPNYFTLLDGKPQLGRVFGPQDEAMGFAEGVVISDGLWRRLFGASTDILGRKIRADNDLYTIIGVMPAGFRHPDQTLPTEVDMWATAGFAANPFGTPVRGQRMLPGAIARVKGGLAIDQAQARVDAVVARLRAEYPTDYPAATGWTIRLAPVRENMVGRFRTTLLVLLAAVGLVLLIGCVNIASLLLARSSARQREMAIRLALGASRGRLVVQLLTESVLLALLVVAWVMDLLLQIVPANIPRLHEVGFSGRVLVFSLIVSLLTGLIFGVAPALQASRPDVVTSLKDGSQGAGTASRYSRFRSALVVIEFALSLVLMIGAGLLLRSFWRLLDVNLGFNAKEVLLTRIWLPVPNNPELDPYRPPEKRVAFAREVLRRASQIPGVEYVAIGSGNGVPLVGPHGSASFLIEGRPVEGSATQSRAQLSVVSPDYFKVLGAPLRQGRFFNDSDDPSTDRVALIDETMARRFWPNEDPLGRRIDIGRRPSNGPWFTIAGIVGDIRTDGVEVPHQPHLYLALLQSPPYAMAVYVRTKENPQNLVQPLRQEVQSVDPNLPVFGERTLEDVVSGALAQRRFSVQLVALFGLVALLLAGVGIYGVMSYAVNQRTREIGIRLALGASATDIMRWVLGQGLVLAAVGVLAGLIASLALTRLLRSMLFEIGPMDPLTYLCLAALLTAIAMLACYLPARRATKVDPLVALRHE